MKYVKSFSTFRIIHYYITVWPVQHDEKHSQENVLDLTSGSSTYAKTPEILATKMEVFVEKSVL